MSFHTRRENRVRNHTIKGLALAAGAFLVAIALSAPANAATLRAVPLVGAPQLLGRCRVRCCGPTMIPPRHLTLAPAPPSGGCDVGGNGDNIIRLINPNGSANPAISGESQQFVCAMIYVFDDDEEMGECCGCPISSAGLLTLSVDHDLTSNFVFGNNPDSNSQGAIAIVAAAQNPNIITFGSPSNGHLCTLGESGACNFGCDPTNGPGYTVSTSDNLLGSITHNQVVSANGGGSTSGLTEIGLFDDASGDPNNLIYLQNECGGLVGGGSLRGTCHCPTEPSF